MYVSKGNDNTYKQGRIWIRPWKTKGKTGKKETNYEKDIGIEWSLRFDPLNFYLELDGSEGRYLFSFWFIWTFYISINGFRNWYYPKEWNSMANNKKGGYIDSATRTIGISMYNWCLSLYFWHDGEDSWEQDKCDKIWHKWINIGELIIGNRSYSNINEKNMSFNFSLPEKSYKLDVEYKDWQQKCDRKIFSFLNRKGKNYNVRNVDIPYLHTVPDEYDIKEGYNGEEMIKDTWISIKHNETDEDFLRKYREYVMEYRCKKADEDWVPEKYEKYYYRNKKLKRVLNG